MSKKEKKKVATKAVAKRKRSNPGNPAPRRRRNRNGIQLPIAVLAGFVPGLIKVWEAWPGGISAAAREAGRIYTGIDFWDANFDWQRLWYGLFPIIGGVLVHRFIGQRMGVNRALRAAGIPFVRL